jgi:hypothetical protein
MTAHNLFSLLFDGCLPASAMRRPASDIAMKIVSIAARPELTGAHRAARKILFDYLNSVLSAEISL